MEEKYKLPYRIRTEWVSYLVWSILFCPMVVIAIIATYQDDTFWPMDILLIIFLGFVILWLKGFKIDILEDKVMYKTLFSRKKEIRYSEVKKMKLEVGVNNQNTAGKGFYRLVFLGSLSETILVINMKPFGKNDLAILIDAVANKSTNVEMDKELAELRDGNLNPVIVTGIKKFWQFALWYFMVTLSISIANSFF